MLQLATVKNEMNDLISDREQNYTGRELTAKEKKQLVKMRKRMQYLKIMHGYLESCPTKEFVKKEIDRIENRITIIDANFSHLAIGHENAIKTARKEYEKENGIPHLRIQLRALRFINKN